MMLLTRRQTLSVMAATALLPEAARGRNASSLAAAGATTGCYADAQGGFDFETEGPDRYRLAAATMRAIRARKLSLISITVGPVGNGPSRFQQASDAVAEWDQVIARNPHYLRKVTSAMDVAPCRADGRLGVAYNFQDTAPLEGEAGRVTFFARLGVKIMQLTYNKRNLAGDGCLESSDGGLSDFGRDVIAKMNEAGVLLDLSHAGERTIKEGIRISNSPVAITHSGCRDLVDLPRNTSDVQMKALADKGGFFGVYLMPFLSTSGQATSADLLRHLDHAVNVCGEDHVGIGTDNPMLGYEINDETRRQQREFFEDRRKRGVAAPGEGPDIFNMIDRYNGHDRFEIMARDLKRIGWKEPRIDKVLRSNFVRLLRNVWKDETVGPI